MSYLRSFVASIPGARSVKNTLFRRFSAAERTTHFPRDRVRDLVSPAAVQGERYGATDSETAIPDTFVLYRIIGNDLVPRHAKGQSRENLQFILQHEPELPGCEKRFIVNRLVDPDEERLILDMLNAAGCSYLHLPFDWNEYASAGWDIEGVPADFAPFSSQLTTLPEASQSAAYIRLYRFKNNYVMNNNGARNLALRDGKTRAKWVLPWDGNCYLTAGAWDELRSSVLSNGEFRYQFVPMARVMDNRDLLDASYRPEAIEEPQVVFRFDAAEEFDPEYCYGRRPKVELFWRLGYPGKWDNWPIEPWDLRCPEYAPDTGRYAEGGWVARLYSGKAEFERQRDQKAWVGRGEARTEAIASMLDILDARAFDHKLDPERPIFVPQTADVGGSAPAQTGLTKVASEALARGPFSVVEKTTLPPGGNPHDYWHPAPYYWPHPMKIPGLPYVWRDGQRVPGTRMYELLSEKYDRTRVQYLFDDTYTLALAWLQQGDPEFGRHGGDLVRHWFLRPDTAMTPHLRYAQVRRGHNKNRGASTGIIEFKDLYYFLDAVRILKSGGFLSAEELAGFKTWLAEYLEWLRTSEQGVGERAAHNNHGTYYDLQVASICAFLGEARLLRETLRDSRIRLLAQFDSEGAQPHELKRTNTAHYCCFNLQGWIHLAQLAESTGEDLWNFTGKDGRGLQKGMEWLLAHTPNAWPYQQEQEFDGERFYPIAYSYLEKYGNGDEEFAVALPDRAAIKAKFHPHDGIRPFWNLIRTSRASSERHVLPSLVVAE